MYIRFYFSTLSTILFLFACNGTESNNNPSEQAQQNTVEIASQLWNKILTEDYRNTFARAPGFATRQPSNAPHSSFVDIFINDTVSQVLNSTQALQDWPIGSLIVKDGYNTQGILSLVALMEKRADGWFWAEFLDVNSTVADFSGAPIICTSCHLTGDDFVRAFSLP